MRKLQDLELRAIIGQGRKERRRREEEKLVVVESQLGSLDELSIQNQVYHNDVGIPVFVNPNGEYPGSGAF